MVDQRRTGAGGGIESSEVMQAAEAAGEEYGKVEGRTQREIVWRRFKRHRLALISAFVLILLYISAIGAPVFAPYGYEEQDFTRINQPPSAENIMGTDRLGRDTFSRVLYGGRVSLMVGLGVGVFSTALGAGLGIISGYYGRAVDVGIMGLTDFVLVLPFLPVMLVLGSIFRFTPLTITLVLIVLIWTQIARLVRGEVLSLRDREFVQAARAIGVSDFKIMVRHILPNVVGVITVQATLTVALAILLESALSFLGLGIQPPTPSWGNMLTDARTTMTQQWWLTIFPGMMIVITTLCINFLGDGLRDALDPKAVE
ncbi:oligopeptide ABC transporter permease [Rubrobacter taiwanensis]|nr:oligopeptide ABC transporter permease [Rubrobacter taiwanensis]